MFGGADEGGGATEDCSVSDSGAAEDGGGEDSGEEGGAAVDSAGGSTEDSVGIGFEVGEEEGVGAGPDETKRADVLEVPFDDMATTAEKNDRTVKVKERCYQATNCPRVRAVLEMCDLIAGCVRLETIPGSLPEQN